MAEFLGIVKLGTFYHNGSALPLPQRPWISNTYPGELSRMSHGDIPKFSGNMNDWVIGDTYTNENKKIKWIKIKDESKILLICDRNILVSLNWNTLDIAGYINGKKIIIDGQKYLCRVLSGGDNYRSGSDDFSGGQPTNEWDRFVVDEDNISGLPKPTEKDLDSVLNYDDFDTTHNQLWHWCAINSWCKETYKRETAHITRGYRSARRFSTTRDRNTGSTIGYADVGWRPVLEVLNAAPLISDSDRNLGNYNIPLKKTYSVTDSEKDIVNIVEKLDSNVIRTLNSQPSAQSYHLDLTSKWSEIDLKEHSVTIEATDSKGAKNTRNWTFTKTNSAPGAPNIITPINNIRVAENFDVVFSTATDAEGDTQKIKLQLADDIGFTKNVETTIDLKRYNEKNKEWDKVTTVSNTDNGKEFKFSAIVAKKNTTKYIRVGSTDSGSNTTTWSSIVTIKVGNVLEVETLPSKLLFKPTKIILRDKKVIDSKAKIQVFACNNAFDTEKVWEDIMEQYKGNEIYTFKNNIKTADDWGVSVKYKVQANDATEEISIEAIGVGVN